MTQPSCSVIVCAYSEERWDDLVVALASVGAQQAPPREVIVVVDHNPRLLARARALPAPGGIDLVAIENREARGLSGARNSGIAVARGELLAFLDDDAVAAPDWLTWLRDACASPDVIAAGGAIVPRWPGRRPRWFPDEFDWVVGCSYRGLPEQVTPVRNLIGANMAIRRDAFGEVGGFRTGIGRLGTRPLGCEETEWCIRARRRWPARRVLYDPRARVTHRVPVARARVGYFLARCYAEGYSKALVTRLVGRGDGLATERAYTMRTLPVGAWRGIVDAFSGRDLAGLARAVAIVVGLTWTTVGYLVGAWRTRGDGPGHRRALPNRLVS